MVTTTHHTTIKKQISFFCANEKNYVEWMVKPVLGNDITLHKDVMELIVSTIMKLHSH